MMAENMSDAATVEMDIKTWAMALRMALEDGNMELARFAVKEIEYIISSVIDAWRVFEEVPIR